MVVYTAAVHAGHPELVDAQEESVAGTFQKRPITTRKHNSRRIERETLHVGAGGKLAQRHGLGTGVGAGRAHGGGT